MASPGLCVITFMKKGFWEKKTQKIWDTHRTIPSDTALQVIQNHRLLPAKVQKLLHQLVMEDDVRTYVTPPGDKEAWGDGHSLKKIRYENVVKMGWVFSPGWPLCLKH